MAIYCSLVSYTFISNKPLSDTNQMLQFVHAACVRPEMPTFSSSHPMLSFLPPALIFRPFVVISTD
jgi:hypothetical protein